MTQQVSDSPNRATDGKLEAEVSDKQDDSIAPTPISKIDLRDPHAIRRELAAVYRDMRAGKIDPSDGTRLAYVLDLIRKSYETGLLQDRLELLEHTIAHRR